MAITPTAAQLAILRLNQTVLGTAAGTTEMAAALPSFKGDIAVDGNAYAQNLIDRTSSLSILSPAQLFAKVVDNISASNITAADKAPLVAALVAFNNAGLTVGATVNLLSAFLYQNADTLANVWTNTAKQVKNQTTVASYYTLDMGKAPASSAALAGVTENPATVESAEAAVAAQTYTLTTGVDTIVGTIGNDTFNGTLGGTATWTALDSIDGAGGSNNILNINDVTGGQNIPGGITVKNIQTMNVASAGAVGTVGTSFDVSGFSGLTTLNISNSKGNDYIKAGSGTAVSVVDTAGTVTLVGGSSQSVTTAGGFALSKASGAIKVTDTAQAAVNSTINDGTTVDVTSSATNPGGTTGTITIGGTTAPTGAVTVVSNLSNAAAAATNMAGGLITITGGTTVSVTQNATQAVMTTASTNSTLTQSAVTVNGTTNTTAVTVKQSAAATAANTVIAAAAATEVDNVKFSALTAGQTLTVDGLTFTAGAAGTTAAQTAAAFANLTKGATQGNSTLGTYSGAMTGLWTTGAVATDTVTFTATTPNAAQAAPAFGGSGTAPTVTNVTTGVAKTDAAGRGGVVNGVVTITDASYAAGTAGTITSVTLDAYGNNSTVQANGLTTLSLANSTGMNVDIDNKLATTLNLTVNKLGAASTLDLDNATAKYTTLNVTTTGSDSTLNVTGTTVQALAVGGTKALDLTGSTLSALKTVTVSGSAGVTGNASGATVTSIDASATSGNNTVTVDTTKATYKGGTGVDKVTTSAGISKAVSLGDGNDVFTVANGISAATAAVDGGAGTDTLTMLAADAVTASGSAAWATNVTNFETLAITGAAGAQTIDLAMLGKYNYVMSNASAGTLTLDKMASGGTLEVTATTAGTGYTVGITDAATGTADVLNVKLSSAAAIAAGTVTAANVETINIASVDTNTTAHTNTMTLVSTKATTVNITGNAGLTLTNTGNTALTAINASEMTGALTVQAAGTKATTITGGSGNDVLTASTGAVADTLIGGAGNDTLTTNAGLTQLTGGAGNDLFVIATPGANVNIYSTILDAAAGDRIQFAAQGVETFTTTKLTLGDTAVFQDFANLAAAGNGSVNGIIKWFQFAGNTYIVEDRSASDSFVNGADIVVKLAGTVDLSTASFNNGANPILLLA